MRAQPKWQGLSATEFESTSVKIHVGHATGAFVFQKLTTIVAKFKKNHNLTEGSAQSLGNFSSRTVNKSQGLGWGQPKKVANIIYVLHLNTDQVAANLANPIMGEKKLNQRIGGPGAPHSIGNTSNLIISLLLVMNPFYFPNMILETRAIYCHEPLGIPKALELPSPAAIFRHQFGLHRPLF